MGIQNINGQTYDLLRKSLDASSVRSKVITNNIAHVNTKNYKRYYVSFEDKLNDSIENLEMKTTNKKHIEDVEKKEDISIKQDKNTIMREDGNNVDIENEVTNQAANTLLYNALVTQINNRLTMRRMVIKEGR